MLLNTRRRMLGLLAAAIGTSSLVPLVPGAFAADTAEKKPECFELKAFGDWKGVASNTQAGARIGQIDFADADTCELRGEFQVAESYDAKLVLFGDPDSAPLPKDFLVKPDNRLIAKSDDGTPAIDVPLCGVCTDIRDDKVSIVLPLAIGALFRAAKSVEMTVKLGDTMACSFTLDCEDLRKALDWAVAKKEALAESLEDDKCTPPAKGCFLTTACCEVVGLPDDCFELRTLRRYRDETLAAMPGGSEAIAAYYRLAPSILDRLPPEQRVGRLLSIYVRVILPSAIAARLGWSRLAHGLYAGMMRALAREFALEVHGLALSTENTRRARVAGTVARKPPVKR